MNPMKRWCKPYEPSPRSTISTRRRRTASWKSLLSRRADLAGLPMAMGDACRLKEERARQFGVALSCLRDAQIPAPVFAYGAPRPPASASIAHPGDRLMAQFHNLYSDQEQNDIRPENGENATPARVAALMQVLTPETLALRQGMIKHLAATPHAEATRALARLAIFSEEAQLRGAAVDALKSRREKDYTEVLVQGLSYPWPAVAQRSSEAIVKLERHDLIPQLLGVLDGPDPRAPQDLQQAGKNVDRGARNGAHQSSPQLSSLSCAARTES